MTIAELIHELSKLPDHSQPVFITAADFGKGDNATECLDDVRSDDEGVYLGSTSLMC